MIASGYIEQCEIVSPKTPAEEEIEGGKIAYDTETEPPAEVDKERQVPFSRNVILLLKRQRRLSIIIASVAALLIIIIGSVFWVSHTKSRPITSRYRNVMMQVENEHELENQAKLLRDYIESNDHNIYTQRVEDKISKIHSLIEDRDYKSALDNAGKLLVNEDYVGIETAYKTYMDRYPNSVSVGQIQRKLAEIRDAIDDQRFEKLKEISQSDYDARISAYDSYLADHPSGKRRQKVESIISDAVEEYCTFLKNEIRAGSCNSIDSLIYEKHKHHILSVLKHSMIADEKNEIRRLLEKGKNELKKNNYGKASEYFEQSLAIVQRSRLKDFQAYRYYESEILSALNNENITYFKKGYLQFKGKWYSSQEYEEILQEHEHVKYEGEWHSPAEYEELMIERGFYKYDNEYFTQVKFIEQVIKPALRSKCAIQE